MTIKTDKATITKAHKRFEDIKQEEKIIFEIDLFIKLAKTTSDRIEQCTTETEADLLFAVVLDGIERRNDFITDLWTKYTSKLEQVSKTKNTLENFYTFCLDAHPKDEICKKYNDSDFEKIKQAVLQKIEKLAGNNKDNWINLSKLTMGSLKEKSNAKQANPRNPISNNSDLQSSSVTESKQQPNS